MIENLSAVYARYGNNTIVSNDKNVYEIFLGFISIFIKSGLISIPLISKFN